MAAPVAPFFVTQWGWGWGVACLGPGLAGPGGYTSSCCKYSLKSPDTVEFKQMPLSVPFHWYRPLQKFGCETAAIQHPPFVGQQLRGYPWLQPLSAITIVNQCRQLTVNRRSLTANRRSESP